MLAAPAAVGGAKGESAATPAALARRARASLTRRFTSELLPIIGPKEDIPAPDMATNEQTMAWMMDTYSMQSGYAVPEIVTGKPISIGGSVFRQEATGAGVVMVIARACDRLGWTLADQRCVVQGFGNVGGIAASELARAGRDRHRRLGRLRRCMPQRRPRHRGAARVRPRARSLEGCDLGARISNDELLELECDILVLAAREDQVTGRQRLTRSRAR